jgi:hypothetical protein
LYDTIAEPRSDECGGVSSPALVGAPWTMLPRSRLGVEL